MKIEKCARDGCEDGRIVGTRNCLQHTGHADADLEVNARLDTLVGGRTDKLLGVTDRDGILRAMHPGERPVPGDLLPDGRVLSDGTLEPYPEDVARAKAVIADLDPKDSDTAQVTEDLRDAISASEHDDPNWPRTPVYHLVCTSCPPNVVPQQLFSRDRNEPMPPHTWDDSPWCVGAGKPGRVIADIAAPPPTVDELRTAAHDDTVVVPVTADVEHRAATITDGVDRILHGPETEHRGWLARAIAWILR